MSCNVPSVSFPELSADPVNPSAGRLKLYAKADGLYTKDDAGVVTPLAAGAAVDSISTLSPIAADRFLYTNGVNQFNVSPITLLARQLLDDPDQATMLTTLGAQPLSADLTAFVTNASWAGSALTLTGSQLTIEDLQVNGASTFDGAVAMNSSVSILTLAIGSPSGPTITTGAGVPGAAAPDGSLYLRSGTPNGSLYVRQNGVWTLK